MEHRHRADNPGACGGHNAPTWYIELAARVCYDAYRPAERLESRSCE